MSTENKSTSWIDDADDLRRFCERIDGGPVAVDTESDHFHAYQAQVCLIQVATPQAAALIDPLAIDAEQLRPLWEILKDEQVVKILHSARNDIIELDRDYGVRINNLFDTQIAARFIGCERNSLSWMLEHLLEVDTGAQFQRFDWTTRPLPKKARRYAIDDARHLLALRDRFVKQLEGGRWLEPFAQQCEYITASVEYEPRDFDPEAWRKINDSSSLDGLGRATLRALYLWRHNLCLQLNRSAVTVVRDRTLLRMARQQPANRAELREVKGLSEQLVDQYARSMLAAIEGAASADAPPKRAPRPTPPPSPPKKQKERYNALRSWRNDTASELDLPTEFIATNATLSEIAKTPPASVAELERFPAILPWHRQMLGDEIVRIASA